MFPSNTQSSLWSLRIYRSQHAVLFGFFLFSVAIFLRISLALQPGIWADEIFSLAMATGHSLEHPAAEADPAFGDFVEPMQAQPPVVFRRYMAHERQPAGLRLVIRAVLRSDTSPPLYYLLLNLWTRAAGTSDAALRLFSTLWSGACFPLIWSLGYRMGRRETAWIACVLFAFSPPALYYSAEGRMYTLVLFLALSLAWSSSAVASRGPKPFYLFLWVVSAAAGLLTHYFLVFVLMACLLWFWIHPGSVSRTYLAGTGLLVGLIVLPWYFQIPESISYWRVTAGWLDFPLTWRQAVTAPFIFAYGYLAGVGVWGGSRWMAVCATGLYVLLILVIIKNRDSLLSDNLQMLWLWVIAACIGPVVFDLLRGTNASLVARYALPGLPAGLLLTAVAISCLPRAARVAFIVLIVITWVPGIKDMFTGPSRAWEPFPEVGAQLTAWAKTDDLIIVHSIPSGVLGVARYVDPKTSIASWVVQLKQRQVPDDLKALTARRGRVALVKVHDLGEPSPAEVWLRDHANLDHEEKFHQLTEILYFSPASRPACAIGGKYR